MHGGSILFALLCIYVHLPYHLSSATINGSCTDNVKQKTLILLTVLPQGDIRWSPLQGPRCNQGMIDLLSSKLDLLVERINEEPDMLPCHKLELVYKKGSCDEQFWESIASGLFPHDRSEVVGILGTGCSVSAVEAVELASRPEIQLVVVHNGGSLMLEKYDNSIGILGSSRSLFDLLLILIKTNNWHNIHILYESGHQYYGEMKNDFLDRLAQNSSGVTTTLVSPLYSFFYPLKEIRSSRVRIVFVLASLDHTKRILCLAYHMGLLYPAYQWVILTHTLSDIVAQKFNTSSEYSFTFSYINQAYRCTNENIIKAVEKAFLVSFVFHSNAQASIINEELKWDEHSEKLDLVYTFYDALYAWIRVLHNVTLIYPDIEFTYANNSLARIIIDQFFELLFEGVSGKINFNSSTGFANRPVYLYQISSGQEMKLGSLKTLFKQQSFDHISDQLQEVAHPDRGVVAFVLVVQLVELIAVISLHTMTIMYRKSPSVKGTSPKLTYLAFVGSYVLIATLMLLCVSWATDFGPEIETPICQIIWSWGLPLSFTLTVGTVTVKTWRLYRIFVHYLDPGKFLTNPSLTLAVLLLASIDIAIAIVWTAVDPMQYTYFEIMLNTGVFLEPECTYSLVWLVLVFLFKAALLVALIVLTVLTRKISNATFTTNSLKIFTYTFSVVFVIGFGIYYLLMYAIQHSSPHAEFLTVFSLLNTLLVLFVTFIIAPPITPILLNKVKGVKFFTNSVK